MFVTSKSQTFLDHCHCHRTPSLLPSSLLVESKGEIILFVSFSPMTAKGVGVLVSGVHRTMVYACEMGG